MKQNRKNFETATTTMDQTLKETERTMKIMLEDGMELPLSYLLDFYRMVKNGIEVDYSKYQIKTEPEDGMDYAIQHHISLFDREVIQMLQSYQKTDQQQVVKNLMVNATLLDRARTYYDVAKDNLEWVFDQWPNFKLVDHPRFTDAIYHIYPESLREGKQNAFIQSSPDELATTNQLLKTAEYLKVIRCRCCAADLLHQTVMKQNQVSYTKTKSR